MREALTALADGVERFGIQVIDSAYRRNPALRALERRGYVVSYRGLHTDALRWKITAAGKAALKQ
jgi:hypothetical protein